MRKELKKSLSFGALIFGLVFLAGCGSATQKNQAPGTNEKGSTNQGAPSAVDKTTPNANSNAGTNLNGNSATTGATNDEDSLLSQEENDAKDAVPSDQETTDLTDSYDNE